MSKRLAVLSTTTVVLVYILLLVGAAVRSMGAGMACPDWPTCNGEWIPPFDPLVFAEWFHRLLVLIVSMLVFIQAALIGATKELRGRLGILAIASVLLLLIQAILGAVTVFENNSPVTVTLHLLVAAIFFAVIIRIRSKQSSTLHVVQDGKTFPTFRRHVYMSLVLVFIQLGLGGMVSSSHAGLVCPDFPMCNGQWLPAMTGLVGLQMMHRFMAYAVVLIIIGTFAVSRKAGLTTGNKRLVKGCLTVVILQFLIGVGLIHAKIPIPMSVAHLGLAMLLWGMLTALVYGIRRN
ncbi:MAG: hypothetical protein COV45_01995 [Deltaproteobacteria bacterium CG11_big_fil_rev_8_21_14_0_20_47_16]|nr:MAG: hypothetical protein COV45_01995 [Deltaproteobacteria bacterium CG11_big_fil_rev_8_21_14_0_20_47_16]